MIDTDSTKIRVKNIRFNFLMAIILKGSSIIFPLITLPYVNRVIGPVGTGSVTFAWSATEYFCLFALLGLPTYGIRAVARVRDDVTELSRIVQELLIINFVASVISYIAFFLSLIYIPKFQSERLLLCINIVRIFFNMIGMEWFFQGIEQYRYITVRQITFKVLSLLAMFLFVRSPKDYIIYGSLSIISNACSNTMNFVHAGKYIIRRPLYNYSFKRHIKPIVFFLAITAATTLYTNMDAVMIGFLLNNKSVGYYELAVKVEQVLCLVVTSLGMVLLPRITYYLSKGDNNRFISLIGTSYDFVILVSVPMSVFFFFSAKYVIDVLGGNMYYKAIPSLQIVIFSLIPLGISNIARMQILAPTNREKVSMLVAFFGVGVNFLVNGLLIPIVGIKGAAIGTLVTETVVAIIQVWMTREIFYRVRNEIKYSKVLLSVGAAFIVLQMINKVIVMPAFFRLVVLATLFFGTYGIMLLFLKDHFVTYYFNEYYTKIKRIVRR